MKTAFIVGVAGLILMMPITSTGGSDSACEGLSPTQKTIFSELLMTQHPYDCCKEPIERCLKHTPVCPLAIRLTNDICRMVRDGTNKSEIARLLRLRAATMTASSTASFELDGRFMAGDPSSPVTLVLYACGRSTTCAKMIPRLYSAVTSGTLKGKVRLFYRPFFLGAMEDAVACGRALTAAAEQNMFWPYLLHLYSHQEDFKMCMISKYADLKGLDSDAFEVAFESPKNLEYLKAARKEGEQNKVDTAPGVFINGRKYFYEPSYEGLIDLLEEEFERSAK